MRSAHRALLSTAMLLLPVPFAGAAPSGPVLGATSDCRPEAPALDEERFVRIGGIEQWVTIRGSDCRNPVILFLHGGPGSPLSPYASAIYGAWEAGFTLVQWDQRGTARTYGRNPPEADSALTLERMTQDGLELTSYLIDHLDADKLILVGGSWGSALGVHMVTQRPELFHAYLGTGQLVSYQENQASTYRNLLELARAAEDTVTTMALEALGPPPWTDPRNAGIVRRATRSYEARTTTPAPDSWWEAAAEYASPRLQDDREAGDDYSYLQFVGYAGDGMFSRIDLRRLGTDFEVPVYLIQGAEDLVTTTEVARAYFDSIEAPAKALVVLPRTGHDPNEAMLDAQYEILTNRVIPSIDR
ncbi:MAG: alpha/beta hydrolase [Gemmatimonadota bacterium]